MDILEINLRAKPHYDLMMKRKRLSDMRKWRKRHMLMFDNLEAFQKWVEYTKWHKRPVKINTSPLGLGIRVFFLDHPANKQLLEQA